MKDSLSVAAVCAECGRYAEPPFTPLYDLYGNPVPWVVCLDCYEATVRANAPPHDAGMDARDHHDIGGEG